MLAEKTHWGKIYPFKTRYSLLPPASILSHLKDQQEFFGGGCGAQAIFQWIESRKKNLHPRFMRRVDLNIFFRFDFIAKCPTPSQPFQFKYPIIGTYDLSNARQKPGGSSVGLELPQPLT